MNQRLPLRSGLRPTAWCINLACHAPIPADAVECPECNEVQTPYLRVTTPRIPLDLGTLAACNVGVLRIYQGETLLEQRVFSMRRVEAALHKIGSERYADACALGGEQ